MPRRIARNVSLTPEHAAFASALVSSGQYGGFSEVVRAALRALQASEAAKSRIAPE